MAQPYFNLTRVKEILQITTSSENTRLNNIGAEADNIIDAFVIAIGKVVPVITPPLVTNVSNILTEAEYLHEKGVRAIAEKRFNWGIRLLAIWMASEFKIKTGAMDIGGIISGTSGLKYGD